MSRAARRRWAAFHLPLLAAIAAAPVAAAPVAETAGAGTAETPADAVPARMPDLLGDLLVESRVLYPLQVGPWTAVDEHRYEEQRLGVSVRYVDDDRSDRWIDLYFYAGGPLDPQTLARVASGERDAIAGAARQAGREVDMGTLEPLAFARGDGAVPAWQLGLSYPGERRASAMLLFAQDLYLVKVRASAESASVESLQGELRDFMQAVAAQLRIANTGACWLPARTAVVAALPAVDHPAVLASYREPGTAEAAAVVLGDRVLVAQSHAARAAELATGMGQALYPGCVAPEAIEPDVPPALREIRIEYRRPSREAQDGRAPAVGRPRAPTRATG